MPRTAEVFSSGWGATEHKVLDLKAYIIANTSMKMVVLPQGQWRGKNYAFYVNGIFQGIQYAPLTAPMEFDFPFDYGTSIGSIEVIEVGIVDGWESGEDPYGWVRVTEQESADRLAIRWAVSPKTDSSTAKASTSITNISLSGVYRWANCEPDQGDLQRGKIILTCTQNPGTPGSWIFRFFSWGQVIAEGEALAGNPLVISESNGSGVSGTALVGAVPTPILMGDDWIMSRWPARYNLHYSVSPLTFPRTPEQYLDDDGLRNYVSLTPTMAEGTYNYTVQSQSEEGVVDPTPPVPTDSPKEIFDIPKTPTITSIVGNCLTGLQVTWTPSDDGTWYTLYRSSKNQPVNFWTWSLPTSFSIPEGETTVVCPPIADFVPLAYDPAVIKGQFATEVLALNTAYEGVQAGYAPQLTLSLSGLKADMVQYERDVDICTDSFEEELATMFDAIQAANSAALALSLTDAAWRTAMYPWHSQLLVWLSQILFGSPGAYTFEGGQLPFSANPAGATSLGSSSDGSTLAGFSVKNDYLLSLIADRFEDVNLSGVPTENAKFRFIMRATNEFDVQEKGDLQYTVEVDSNGDVVPTRPNQAHIRDISWSGLTATITVVVKRDNEDVTPTHVDFYWTTTASGYFDWTTPTSSTAIGDEATDMYVTVVTATFPAAGFYNIACKSRVLTTGARSAKARSQWVRATNDDPEQVSNISAKVMRGREAQAVQPTT